MAVTTRSRGAAAGRKPSAVAGSAARWRVLLVVLLPSFLVHSVLDTATILLISQPLFSKLYGGLYRDPPDYAAGTAAWLCITWFTWRFATSHASTVLDAASQGAWLGGGVYAVCQLTNLTVLSTWTWLVVAEMTAVGAVLCGTTASVQKALSLSPWAAAA